MNRKEKGKITPVVTEHWKNKFEKGVKILLKSGYQPHELIAKINEIVAESEKIEKQQTYEKSDKTD